MGQEKAHWTLRLFIKVAEQSDGAGENRDAPQCLHREVEIQHNRGYRAVDVDRQMPFPRSVDGG